MDGIAIQTEDLTKVYGGGTASPVHALSGLTLSVRQGEIFGLLGRNGAGKTTLLRILTTLIPSSRGRARVMNHDVATAPLDVRRSICVVLQENAVEQYLSVEDNLRTYARFHSIPPREMSGRAERAMEQFGLTEFRRQKVIDLSGGLKRRVQVAKVFMVDKPVIFLDEATTGMDPINKRATLDAIRAQAKAGRTIFLTTHILQEAEELCDTVAIIDRGTTVATGDLQTIKSLSSGVFDMTVTFDALTSSVDDLLGRLPVLTLRRKGTTVELSLRSRDISAVDAITQMSAAGTILHFEVTSATLEDVFLELLAHRKEGSPS
jgi:ABC-2 type transport system ATP-binding protein